MLNASAARERLPIRLAAPGRCARWALDHGPKDHKRKHKVLVLIGAYLDAGIRDPSIRELAARTALPGSHVVTIVDWLERRGLIAVERSDSRDRNRYQLVMCADRPGTARTTPAETEKGSVSVERHPRATAKTKPLHQDSFAQESVR